MNHISPVNLQEPLPRACPTLPATQRSVGVEGQSPVTPRAALGGLQASGPEKAHSRPRKTGRGTGPGLCQGGQASQGWGPRQREAWGRTNKDTTWRRSAQPHPAAPWTSCLQAGGAGPSPGPDSSTGSKGAQFDLANLPPTASPGRWQRGRSGQAVGEGRPNSTGQAPEGERGLVIACLPPRGPVPSRMRPTTRKTRDAPRLRRRHAQNRTQTSEETSVTDPNGSIFRAEL